MARGKIGQSNGKLVDTWHYEYQGIPQGDVIEDDEDLKPSKLMVKGIKVAVQLFIHKKFKASDTPPLEVKEVFFTVKCKEPKFSLQGSDIESLRAAMWEHLDDHFKVNWERYYLVKIEDRRPYEGSGSGLCFSYSDIWKGTAWDGSLLMKEYKYRDTVISPWPGEFVDQSGKVIACIPRNQANTEALEAFSKKVDLLREFLADFLRPDRIMQTLANLGGIPFLPGGKNEE